MRSPIHSVTQNQTYTVTTEHAASSHGIPVLLDEAGQLVDFSVRNHEIDSDLYFALSGASYGDDVALEMMMAAYHHRAPKVAPSPENGKAAR